MGSVRIFLMGVFGGNSLCCVLECFAATAWRPAGKGHSDSVVPPAVADFFGMIRLLRLPASQVSSSLAHGLSLRLAPYAVAAGLTAEEVWKGLGFGV